MDDIDVWRSAHQMIKRFGHDASVRAVTRADVYLDMGDIEGHRTWRRIVRAINDLTHRNSDGETLN